MRGRLRIGCIAACLFVVGCWLAGAALPASADTLPFADPAFRGLWDRSDAPVAAKTANRTFLWGPGPISTGMQEKYAQSPGGVRLVQYFDKSRMEITNPTNATTEPFYVSNGLLVQEMMTGRIQVGSDSMQVEPRDPAAINVVGDLTDTTAPTYETLATLQTRPARAMGTAIGERIDRDGNVTQGGPTGATAVTLVPETRHTIASVFWAFMNGPAGGGGTTPNPFYATGYPLTEAYWATVKVGGTPKDVLVQAFERRVLTYTPGNPSGFEVEAGNVGQHYYQWRYLQPQPQSQSRPTGTVDPPTPNVTIDPSTPIGPIVPTTALTGKYNLITSDLPERFAYRLDGEVTNGYLAHNNPDPNYGMYLGQWQRLTGYRRAFTRNEPENQVSTVQSIISVFRNDKGALAELNWDRDRLRNQPGITLLDGPYGSSSYVSVDSSQGTTLIAVIWQQGNTLNTIDVTAAPKGGLAVADARGFAQAQYRRVNLDIP